MNFLLHEENILLLVNLLHVVVN